MTRTVSNCQYDTGVKGKGQAYYEFVMAGNTTLSFVFDGVHIFGTMMAYDM